MFYCRLSKKKGIIFKIFLKKKKHCAIITYAKFKIKNKEKIINKPILFSTKRKLKFYINISFIMHEVLLQN